MVFAVVITVAVVATDRFEGTSLRQSNQDYRAYALGDLERQPLQHHALSYLYDS